MSSKPHKPLLATSIEGRALPDAHPVLAGLAEHFAIRRSGLVHADLLLPGVATVAFVLTPVEDLQFHFKRTRLLKRLRAARLEFKDVFWLLVSSPEHTDAMAFVTEMQLETDGGPAALPVPLLCPSEVYVVHAIKVFSVVFTRERDAARQKQLALLDAAFARPEVVFETILPTVPGVRADNKDLMLLYDCLGSLKHIASASAEEMITSTPCSSETAVAVDAFFHEE